MANKMDDQALKELLDDLKDSDNARRRRWLTRIYPVIEKIDILKLIHLSLQSEKFSKGNVANLLLLSLQEGEGQTEPQVISSDTQTGDESSDTPTMEEACLLSEPDTIAVRQRRLKRKRPIVYEEDDHEDVENIPLDAGATEKSLIVKLKVELPPELARLFEQTGHAKNNHTSTRSKKHVSIGEVFGNRISSLRHTR